MLAFFAVIFSVLKIFRFFVIIFSRLKIIGVIKLNSLVNSGIIKADVN